MLTKIKSFPELFGIELRYAYDCEQKLVKKGLPAMIEAATSPELRSALEQHLRQTQQQVMRLEKVFALVGMEPETKDNDIIDKIMSAAKDSVSNIDSSALRDAALVINGNTVEHYEIAMYGSLANFARNLGLENAVDILEETLREEKEADARLTQIGVSSLNPRAVQEQRAASA